MEDSGAQMDPIPVRGNKDAQEEYHWFAGQRGILIDQAVGPIYLERDAFIVDVLPEAELLRRVLQAQYRMGWRDLDPSLSNGPESQVIVEAHRVH